MATRARAGSSWAHSLARRRFAARRRPARCQNSTMSRRTWLVVLVGYREIGRVGKTWPISLPGTTWPLSAVHKLPFVLCKRKYIHILVNLTFRLLLNKFGTVKGGNRQPKHNKSPLAVKNNAKITKFKCNCNEKLSIEFVLLQIHRALN